MADCKACGGTGRCANCDGKGFITSHRIGIGARKCKVCNGKQKCQVCKGTGRR